MRLLSCGSSDGVSQDVDAASGTSNHCNDNFHYHVSLPQKGLICLLCNVASSTGICFKYIHSVEPVS